MGIAFFKVPKIKQFEYKPRYYDEDRERLAQRRRELGLEDPETIGNGTGTPGSLIRGGAMRARHDAFSREMKTRKRRSQLTLVLLIVVLSFITYLMMREFSEEFMALFFKH